MAGVNSFPSKGAGLPGSHAGSVARPLLGEGPMCGFCRKLHIVDGMLSSLWAPVSPSRSLWLLFVRVQ